MNVPKNHSQRFDIHQVYMNYQQVARCQQHMASLSHLHTSPDSRVCMKTYQKC
ncbi:hypothetical protein KC19_9G024000 [Ceratodon purpureus]|uniref:Uncharacterized protein n=1 Tax=Ceratodon purpureus TaxID=3225 RepID=A0A8T0GVH4_CERPU|nr:hypothetical protein KC19_9G024000 [Ceratodon purpureus]